MKNNSEFTIKRFSNNRDKAHSFFSNQSVFLLFSIIAVIIRLWTLRGLPIYIIPYSVHDDRMMVNIAHSLGSGGIAYDEFTLVKGWMFPLFLAMIHKLGISYITSIHLINGALASLTSFALLPEKKRFSVFHYLLTIALIFNPAFTSSSILMRVYRNAFSALTAYAVVISAIALYLRRAEKKSKWILWITIASIALPAFWYTREDSIWLFPFYLGVVVVTIVSMLIAKQRSWHVMLICLLLPLISLESTTQITRMHRNIRYGQPVVNELSEGEFPRVMKSIYGVKMNTPQPQYVAASREKIDLLYAHSPTLARYRETLEMEMDEWSQYGRLKENHQNHEVENGWFFWCLRETIADEGGFSSLTQSQQIFKSIADELEVAFNSGMLERQIVMPSTLMPPWTTGTFERLIDAVIQIPDYVSSFSGTGQGSLLSEKSEDNACERFEDITNNHAVYSEDDPRYPAAIDAKNRLQSILDIYQRIWPFISKLGRFCSLISLLLVFVIKNTSMQLREQVWILAGLAGALLVLYCGVGYNHAESCGSINSLYLSAAYPLMILFDLLAIRTSVQGFLCLKIKSHKK